MAKGDAIIAGIVFTPADQETLRLLRVEPLLAKRRRLAERLSISQEGAKKRLDHLREQTGAATVDDLMEWIRRNGDRLDRGLRGVLIDKAAEHLNQVQVVRSIPTDPDVRASASLFLTETDRQGVRPGRRMLEIGRMSAPAHVAARMGLAEGDPILIRSKLMLANDIPVRISNSYFLLSLAEGTRLMEPGFVEGGLEVLLRGLGWRFGRAVETLTARMPTHDEVRMLQAGPEAPIVQILRTSYDPNDHPIHTLESICVTNRHVFVVPQVQGDNVF
ncbi:MAG: UTRA domain-containing protein [Actinomycetota bacterium]